MLVMTANNRCASVLSLARRFPGLVGNLYSPPRFARPRPDVFLPYALDNGAFSAWRNGRPFDAEAFLALCDVARDCGQAPMWVVVPDVVGERDATLRQWDLYRLRLQCRYGWPLAFAAQDGMTPDDVPAGADVVFIGGSTLWKRRNIGLFCREFPRVHVARINTREWLWRCFDAGAESIDGTGFFRGDRAQTAAMENFIEFQGQAAGAHRQLTMGELL